MPRKKEADIEHPEKAHPTLPAEEAKERQRQRQRDRPAQRRLERSTASSNVVDPAPIVLKEEPAGRIVPAVGVERN